MTDVHLDLSTDCVTDMSLICFYALNAPLSQRQPLCFANFELEEEICIMSRTYISNSERRAAQIAQLEEKVDSLFVVVCESRQ